MKYGAHQSEKNAPTIRPLVCNTPVMSTLVFCALFSYYIDISLRVPVRPWFGVTVQCVMIFRNSPLCNIVGLAVFDYMKFVSNEPQTYGWANATTYMSYPTPGCENQWIWAVVSKGVDTTGPNWIQHPNLHNCTSGAHVFMAFMPYLATLDLLLMPKVNGVYRLYVSFNNPLLYWLHNTVCSKYSLDNIAKREIIKRLFCHVIHGDMTSQLDIAWQRGETIAKYLFISIWKLANGMAQNHISGVNLNALYT